MLQFTTLMHTAGKSRAPKLLWRFSALFSTNPAETVNVASNLKDDVTVENTYVKSTVVKVSKEINNSAPLKENAKSKSTAKKQLGQEDIQNILKSAKSINEVLNIAVKSNINKETASLCLTDIVKRMNSGTEVPFEVAKDARFKQLQKILFSSEQKTKPQVDPKMKYILTKLENGNTNVLSELSVPQMIEVFKKISISGKRPAPVLRALSCNIIKNSTYLDMRQCSNVLHSLAILKFPDQSLLQHITHNILENVKAKRDKFVTWTIFSMIKSIGLLRYKNEELMHVLCSHIVSCIVSANLDQLHTFAETVATISYKTKESVMLLQIILNLLNKEDEKDRLRCLDLVWALVILQEANEKHISSVLDQNFIEKLDENELTVTKKLKLLNINAVAQYEMQYKGPKLSTEHAIYHTPLILNKENGAYVHTLSETLDCLMPSKDYFQTNINTNMGFNLDAEYCISSDGSPVIFEKANDPNIERVGIMIHHYSDYCVMHPDLTGRVLLYKRLLSAKGYKVLSVDYRDFSPSDSSEKRIHYMKTKMATVVKRK